MTAGVDLYVVYLGGDPVAGRLGEDHEVVVVAARGMSEARRVAKSKWTGAGRPHIDAVRVVDVVDGYRVALEPTTDDERPVIDMAYEPAEPETA